MNGLTLHAILADNSEIVLEGLMRIIERMPCEVQPAAARTGDEMLRLSDNTIETHRRSLLAKLNAHNAAELVAQAVRLGFVCPEPKTNF